MGWSRSPYSSSRTPATPQPVGLSQQGGVNVYSRQLNEHLVTVLGEAPGATVRQIAYSVGPALTSALAHDTTTNDKGTQA